MAPLSLSTTGNSSSAIGVSFRGGGGGHGSSSGHGSAHGSGSSKGGKGGTSGIRGGSSDPVQASGRVPSYGTSYKPPSGYIVIPYGVSDKNANDTIVSYLNATQLGVNSSQYSLNTGNNNCNLTLINESQNININNLTSYSANSTVAAANEMLWWLQDKFGKLKSSGGSRVATPSRNKLILTFGTVLITSIVAHGL